MDIPILYEDEHILAIDKPSGLLVHPDGRSDEATLIDWIRAEHPELEGVGEPLTLLDGETVERPGIVHRLDRETSGALLIAKDQETFLYLKRLFQAQRVKKEYRTFLWGELKHDFGTIDRPIAKSRRDFRRWSAQPGTRGVKREAITEYEVIARGAGFTYAKAFPRTGRTHQIRVHFKALNHPVVCDTLYGPKEPCALGFDRLALHSFRLMFPLPRGGGDITIEAPLPEAFIGAEATLGGTA